MSSADFFISPEPQSIVKTKLVAQYFGGWSRVMLARSTGAIAFVDLFSGPGAFENGAPSTPLWILNNALKNEKLSSRLVTIFNDKEQETVQKLQAAIHALPRISNLTYQPRVLNRTVGREIIEVFQQLNGIPTLSFIDPWGYKGLSLNLIGSTIQNRGCECIFFFNYNRINLGLTNEFVARHMSEIFGPERFALLREKVKGQQPEDRQSVIINELAEALKDVGGRFVLPFQFHSRHGDRVSHYLIFVGKHFRGYHIMKEVMYKLSSDDGMVREFEYIPAKSPQLPLLFELAEPFSIESLKASLLHKCANRSLTADQLYEEYSVDTRYVLQNFKLAINQLADEGKVTVDVPREKRMRGGILTLGNNRVVTFPP